MVLLTSLGLYGGWPAARPRHSLRIELDILAEQIGGKIR
jgi:hypothetical protein